MSLFALPVSVSDLTQLQLGIEFFTNTTEATIKQGQITDPPGTPTVYTYAANLLAKNISLSQVAMAVDSLMFGVTDNLTELTKLATNPLILPAQVANANANGLNPTVYAAEALGLGLAGGNGSGNAFATNFGSLSVPDFASEVATLTGINSGAIQGFVNNWIQFYTANPPGGGLSAQLAAYGAAFGDAVGVALLNPTVNGSIALLVSEVQNALIDNAEGLYKTGIPLIAEPPHLPLQGEALLIPNAGGGLLGPTIDWDFVGGPGAYAQFVAPAQTAQLEIDNGPSIFTLNTQHFATQGIHVEGHNGQLFTLILGDSTASESLNGFVLVSGYSVVDIVVAKGPGTDSIIDGIGTGSDLVISGSGSLSLGGVEAVTIADYGVSLTITAITGEIIVDKIDASNAPILVMGEPAIPASGGGVTILGGTGPGNILQGSINPFVAGSTVTFSNGSTGFSVVSGPDNFTGGSGGNDAIGGDGGPDTISLPNHLLPDGIVFGEALVQGQTDVLAITDGNDVAYPGYWGASATATAIPTLFPGNTGGTSTDMTVITGFHAGSGGDVLEFKVAAWNGGSKGQFFAAPKGDLVALDSAAVVLPGAAQLSNVWIDSGSNSSLKGTDNLLLYAPSGVSVPNAQELATLLHTSSDAITLPGPMISPGQDKHILVVYNGGRSVNIADVDLVNTSGASNQSSTADLNVYASDMVSLTGVSLANLTSTNVHFI